MAFVPDSDVNDSDFSLPAPGWHKVEVSEAEKKRSSRNDAMFNLTLVDPATKKILGWDVAMLEGKGNGIGIAKLEALGAAEKLDGGWNVPDAAGEIVGCRAWAYFVHEKYTKDGEEKTRAKVSIDFGSKGYMPEDDTPPAVEMATKAGDGADPFNDDLDVPF